MKVESAVVVTPWTLWEVGTGTLFLVGSMTSDPEGKMSGWCRNKRGTWPASIDYQRFLQARRLGDMCGGLYLNYKGDRLLSLDDAHCEVMVDGMPTPMSPRQLMRRYWLPWAVESQAIHRQALFSLGYGMGANRVVVDDPHAGEPASHYEARRRAVESWMAEPVPLNLPDQSIRIDMVGVIPGDEAMRQRIVESWDVDYSEIERRIAAALGMTCESTDRGRKCSLPMGHDGECFDGLNTRWER